MKHMLDQSEIQNFPFISESEKPHFEPTVETIQHAAKLLSENKIIGWYQGMSEVGPRALGNRSILMNPMIKNGKEKINKIKNRENYRPFGGVILDEFKKDYFDCDDSFDNPYMLFVADVIGDNLKSITHVDKTCRIQTLKNENPVLRRLLLEFYKLTGCPILLNTSLNVAGKPIAAHKADAIHLLNNSRLDYVFIGDQFYEK
jgi:carbamoyltransferase